MNTTLHYREVEELQRQFARRKGAICSRLREFTAVPQGEYFYELIYCLLTPQSSAVNAGIVVDALKAADFLRQDVDPLPLLFTKNHYIRFHNTKGKHLLKAKIQFPQITAALRNGFTSVELRAWLATNVEGMGWKEASHFLRNIGHRNLAILDRHILRNLVKHGVIPTLPLSLTPSRYITIEQSFLQFAGMVGIGMDELDLLFWSNETGEILK